LRSALCRSDAASASGTVVTASLALLPEHGPTGGCAPFLCHMTQNFPKERVRIRTYENKNLTPHRFDYRTAVCHGIIFGCAAGSGLLREGCGRRQKSHGSNTNS